jgi:hypothetical protein
MGSNLQDPLAEPGRLRLTQARLRSAVFPAVAAVLNASVLVAMKSMTSSARPAANRATEKELRLVSAMAMLALALDPS